MNPSKNNSVFTKLTYTQYLL